MSLLDMAREALSTQPDRIMQEMHKPAAVQVAGDAWIAGLDLGQTTDPSALVLLRQSKIERGRDRRRYYDCLAIKRWPLKTAYTAIVDDVCTMFARPEFSGHQLAIDMTGVGRPVVDLFRKQRVKAKIVPITIHGGSASSRDDDGGWSVAKRELVSIMHVFLGGCRFGTEQRLFQVAASLPLAGDLKRELENFTVKININTANASFEAHRASAHDDIVLAVCIAVFCGELGQKKFVLG